MGQFNLWQSSVTAIYKSGRIAFSGCTKVLALVGSSGHHDAQGRKQGGGGENPPPQFFFSAEEEYKEEKR